MNQKKYWQSFAELNESAAAQKLSKDEFQEELPFEADDKGFLNSKAPRRDFLKYLGFSTAAATIAAGCEMPVKKSIPYLNRPDDIIPGIPNYYATTYVSNGDVVPVVVKVRDGRPIKVEGNSLSYLGEATSARVQASVLSLYDVARQRFPLDEQQETMYDKLDSKIIAAINALPTDKKIVLLSSTLNSITEQEVINIFSQKFAGRFEHVQYDAVSYNGLLDANEHCYGKRSIPAYRFENAKTIVSLGADFLGTWLNPVEFAKGYAANRRVSDKKKEMSTHFHFEASLSMTGANADYRYTHRPSETGAVAIALLEALNGKAPSFSDKKLNEGITKAAESLKNAKGLVVCGSNDKNIQIVVNAINQQLNNDCIDWTRTVNYRKGDDKKMSALLSDIQKGSIGALMIYGANPVYNHPSGEAFAKALKFVSVSISFNERLDETSMLCKYVLPTPHYLESWGDAEPFAGYVSFIQPTIAPLFKTRAFATSLLNWSGNAANNYETFFKEYWKTKFGSAEAFDLVLRDGVKDFGAVASTLTYTDKSAEAIAAINLYSKLSGKEIVLYEKVSIGDGTFANNPWLQELPDPITKATWDNYAIISIAAAEKLGIKVDDEYEVHPEKPVISIKVGNSEKKLPILAIPGVHDEVVAVAVGYGRGENITDSVIRGNAEKTIGRSALGTGVNVYPWINMSNGHHSYYNVATIALTNETYPIAYTQTHNVYEDRNQVVRETNLKAFKEHPDSINEESKELRETFGEDYRNDATLYPKELNDRPGIHWGMSIDLNTCTGCAACVVACTAENNVSVVGKKQVMASHEMHWLRIDRYFASSKDKLDDVEVVFQPMMCQHCDHAPCENVCPVAATNHSSEGLNQMTYNRCIGTRYCANNCPYKVRRFNWYDWNGADSFPNNQTPMVDDGYLDAVILDMNDDLTRMVLNPDVTVRSRGVIEKCSFCVQRLQEGKLAAKKESRTVKDGEVKTACMQACPTNAIVFGNANDKQSALYKIRNEEQKQRSYSVLEQLHVLPNVTYLAKVRNTDKALVVEEKHG